MENSNLVEEKFKILFQQQMQKYEKQVQLLKDTIQGLAMEQQALRSQIAELQNMKQREQPVIKQQESQRALSSENKAPHPRQGNYKPEDVDIKKMFYFGHK
jgi:septal ring factor EnvC (AmiA/AmiB activator)